LHSIEWSRFLKIGDAPGTSDHRVWGQACASGRDDAFKLPPPILCGERRGDAGSMALQVTLQLQAQHAKRRLACQYRIELTDSDLYDARRQTSKGIAGG
jgi:hypothetical protein